MNEIRPLVAYPLAYLALAAVLAIAAGLLWWYTRPHTNRDMQRNAPATAHDYHSATQRYLDQVDQLRAAWQEGSIALRELHLAAARVAREYGSALQGENYLAATRTQLERRPAASDVAAVVALCEAPSFSDREEHHVQALFAALDALGGERQVRS